MKNRTISLLILTAILLSSAVGCGGGTSEDTTAGTTASTEDTSTSAPETTDEYVAPDVDYKGAEIAVVTLTDWASNYRICDYNLITEEENGDLINDATVKAKRAVEEALNVKLVRSGIAYNAPNNTSAMSTSIMAGDDEFKFAAVRTIGLPALLGQPDQLVDLGELSTLDLSSSWWQQSSVEEFNLFGKQYAVAGDLCFYSKGAPICYFFNKQVAEDLKLGNFYDLVYDGSWTLDKLIELSSDAYADLNGDTKVDPEDRFGLFCEDSSLTYALVGSGIRYAEHSGDEIKLSLNSSKTIALIEKLVPAWNQAGQTINAHSLPFPDTYASKYTDLFTPTFAANRALFYTNQLLNALDFRNMNSDFGVLPIPKFDEAQKDYYGASNTWWSENIVIPATNTELDMTGHVLDAFGYYSKLYTTTAFIDETVINKSLRDEDSANIIQMIFDTQVYDVGLIFNWGGLYAMVNGMVSDNDTGFASNYAAYESAALGALETTAKQLKGN